MGTKFLIQEMITMKKIIMVVDDDKVYSTLIPFILKGEGFKVIVCEDGTEALQKFDEEPPNLVLLDINMPHIDGFEVCSAIKTRADTKSIPVIMTTSSDMMGDIEKAFEVGAEEYLVKPFDKEKLLKMIHKHIG